MLLKHTTPAADTVSTWPVALAAYNKTSGARVNPTERMYPIVYASEMACCVIPGKETSTVSYQY